MNSMPAVMLSGLMMMGGAVLVMAQPAATQPAGEQSADQMLDRMLNPAGGEQTIQPAPTQSVQVAGQGGSVKQNVLREGSYVVDRVGRLSSDDDKQRMEFVFDSDGKALRDPPIVVLPSLKLMDMEWARETKGPETRFRITGMVTEYRGRNYILLDKVVVVTDR